MRKTFVIVHSGIEVDDSADRGIRKLTKTILSRTVTVKTEDCVGEGLFIADKIVTSLFLVQDQPMVKVIAFLSEPVYAVVSKKDESVQLAELTPVMIGRGDRYRMPAGQAAVNTRTIGESGRALLMARSGEKKPTVTVSGMLYRTQTCDRRDESAWDIMRRLPAGLAGGGVWNLEGEVVGLSLGSKKVFSASDKDMLLALPIESVLDFVETS